MADGHENTITILQRKKKAVKLSKVEILMMLRAYRSHPTNWSHIIGEIKENMDSLPETAKELYNSSTHKQIRDRLSNKFGKLMCEKHILDDDIRVEVEAITRFEKRLVQTTAKETATTSTTEADMRDVALSEFSDSDDVSAGNNPGRQMHIEPSPTNSRRATSHAVATLSALSEPPLQHGQPSQAHQQRRQSRKRPLMDIVRENQLHYNRFITKKVPKLLRQLGVSSDESD